MEENPTKTPPEVPTSSEAPPEVPTGSPTKVPTEAPQGTTPPTVTPPVAPPVAPQSPVEMPTPVAGKGTDVDVKIAKLTKRALVISEGIPEVFVPLIPETTPEAVEEFVSSEGFRRLLSEFKAREQAATEARAELEALKARVETPQPSQAEPIKTPETTPPRESKPKTWEEFVRYFTQSVGG